MRRESAWMPTGIGGRRLDDRSHYGRGCLFGSYVRTQGRFVRSRPGEMGAVKVASRSYIPDVPFTNKRPQGYEMWKIPNMMRRSKGMTGQGEAAMYFIER